MSFKKKIKNIVRIPARIIRKVILSKAIALCDSNCVSNLPSQSDTLCRGWIKSNIDDILDFPGISQRMRESSMRRPPMQGMQIFWSWDIPYFVWEALLKSTTLPCLIFNYLGPGARLDDLYLKSIEDGLISGAEGWHNDNVGYRLKLFMVFDVEGTPSDTILLPARHPNPYRFRILSETIRMLGFINNKPRPGEVRVGYQAGDCLLFDTNLEHRGDYTSSSGIRYCLVAEFIDRTKANSIYRWSPCGPGQGRFPVKVPIEVHELLASHPLVDVDLLSEQDGLIYYGYSGTAA